MKSYELEFYAHLGLLAVKFAQMEYKLSAIVGKLFGTDDDLIPMTVLENNSLSMNIGLLKKLNRIQNFQKPVVTDLIQQIIKIQSDRNLFIHGIWSTPDESDGSVIIICDEKRIKYEEKYEHSWKGFDQIWYHSKKHIFSLSDIKKRINDLNDILATQDSLIKDLENYDFI